MPPTQPSRPKSHQSLEFSVLQTCPASPASTRAADEQAVTTCGRLKSYIPPFDLIVVGESKCFPNPTAILFAASKLLFRYGPVFQTSFDINDPLIAKSYGESTVSMTLLTIIYLYIPLVLFILYERLYSIPRILHSRLLINFLASCVCPQHFSNNNQVVVNLFTDALKLMVGELRPNFLSQCIPDPDTMLCTSDADGSRISFPSGHASTAFNSAIFIALYVFCRVRFLKKSRVLRVICAMLPVVFAVYVGMTRIRVCDFN
jgi:membrane-associated phospholipid phosphatase